MKLVPDGAEVLVVTPTGLCRMLIDCLELILLAISLHFHNHMWPQATAAKGTISAHDKLQSSVSERDGVSFKRAPQRGAERPFLRHDALCVLVRRQPFARHLV